MLPGIYPVEGLERRFLYTKTCKHVYKVNNSIDIEESREIKPTLTDFSKVDVCVIA